MKRERQLLRDEAPLMKTLGAHRRAVSVGQFGGGGIGFAGNERKEELLKELKQTGIHVRGDSPTNTLFPGKHQRSREEVETELKAADTNEKLERLLDEYKNLPEIAFADIERRENKAEKDAKVAKESRAAIESQPFKSDLIMGIPEGNRIRNA